MQQYRTGICRTAFYFSVALALTTGLLPIAAQSESLKQNNHNYSFTSVGTLVNDQEPIMVAQLFYNNKYNNNGYKTVRSIPGPASNNSFMAALQNINNFDEVMQRGDAELDKKNYNNAILAYSRAIALSPTDALAYYNRAWARIGANTLDDALNDATRAIELDANFTLAYNARGLIKTMMNRYEQSISDFDQAINLDPNFELAYNNRAFSKYNLSDYEGAIIDYGIAIAINPTSAVAYSNRALAKYANGDYNEALVDANQSIALDTKFGQAYYNRAYIKQALGISNSTDLATARALGVYLE
ncbi:MAG: tetratricopeptide repeat protein [Alphaproteobacteria bacterium]|nr:tetratricopeptide repeat protein [Alphaproteobacteria bacterium]